jgi:ubiquitin C-terminal hydrolase
MNNGLTGLTNQGNTCYVNSIIQCLSNCKDFRNFILNKKIIHLLNNSENIYIAKKKLDNTLTFQLRKILSYFWFNNYDVIELASFRKIFCKKIQMFRNFNQHDSQEALLCIIDTIHEELAQEYDIIPNNKDIQFDTLKYYHDNNLEYNILPIINNDINKYLYFKSFIDFKNTHKNYSKIYDIFEGRTISQLKCPVTNCIKANFESQFYFTLSLADNEFSDVSSSEISSSKETSDSEDEIENYKSIVRLKNENESNELFTSYESSNDEESSNELSTTNESSDEECSIEYESNEYDYDDYIFTKVKKCNIYDLFDNFIKVETLDNDNQWFSPYCQKKVNAERVNFIWDCPKVFIILIKRFEYTEYGAEKLNHLVDFPIYDLDISKYLHPNHVSKNIKYNLFAINNHDSMNSNGINFGHYYSYCKNSINNKWYNFDDDDVDEISEDELVTNKAYMLFYEASN